MIKRIRSNRILGFVWDVVHIYYDRNVSRSASSLAYFLLLTFFPILLCVNAFIGMLELDATTIFHALDGILPDSVLSVLMEYIGYLSKNQSNGIFILGLIMTISFASAAIRQLMIALEEFYGHRSKGTVKRVITSIFYSLFILINIYFAMYIMLVGSNFFVELLDYFHLPNPVQDGVFLGYLMIFALILLFIILIYRLSIPKGEPKAPVIPGGVASAIILVIATRIFSNMMGGATSRYSIVYGTLSSVIILIVWLYLCGTVLIMGNAINVAIYWRKCDKLGVPAQGRRA